MIEDVAGKALYWLKRAYLAVDKRMDEGMARHDLSAAQMQVLMAVANADGIKTNVNGGVEHRELLEWMGVSSPTLTNLVDKLVERGYIERHISPDDARVKLLYPTERSRELQREMQADWKEYAHVLMRGFSQGEIALLGELLERLAHNAGEADMSCLPSFKPKE